MAFIFKFPDIGEGITEGKILKWYVKAGQAVKSGDSLVKMETDKVVTDIPSPKKGTIAKTFGKEGETINVDDPLVEITLEGESPKPAAPEEKSEEPKTEAVAEKGFGVVGTIEVASDKNVMPASDEGQGASGEARVSQSQKVLATPVARAMAKDLGVDINRITGTGPAGRVMKADIQSFHASHNRNVAPSADHRVEGPDIEYRPLSQIRKTIAKNMTVSKHSAPHMTAFEDVEVSELIALRKRYKDTFAEEGVKLTYIPFIFKAVAAALRAHPELNSEMDLEKGQLLIKNRINIGMAVDTAEGLIVPVVKNADKLSIKEIAVTTNDLAERGKKRELTLPDLKEGTFTVTNYGSIAGTYGVPIINYPQAAILGIGRIMKMPVVNGDKIEIGHVLPLSLSVDHRIVDGGEAARFLVTLKGYLKDPVSLIMA